VPTARVATRPGPSGVAEHRRRLYQRHLLLFLTVCGLISAADWLTSPGFQWAYFLVVPWFLVFLIHSLALKSRGYSVGEMVIPPRATPAKEVYTVLLDYELVRTRQIRDGVFSSSGALRDRPVAEAALAAADDLVSAVEALVAASRNKKYHADEQAKKLVPKAQEALEALDALHRGLLKTEILSDETELPVDAVRGRAAELRKLAGE
jgi:hypothetical protein